MRCDEVRERLPEFGLNVGDEEVLRRVRVHLETCPACAGELALLAAVRGLPVPEPKEGFFDALPGAVAARIAARGRGRGHLLPFRRNPWIYGGIGTAAAAAALLLWLSPGPARLLSDGEFLLAVNSSPFAAGVETELALAGVGVAEGEWSEGIEGFSEEELESLDRIYTPQILEEMEEEKGLPAGPTSRREADEEEETT